MLCNAFVKHHSGLSLRLQALWLHTMCTIIAQVQFSLLSKGPEQLQVRTGHDFYSVCAPLLFAANNQLPVNGKCVQRSEPRLPAAMRRRCGCARTWASLSSPTRPWAWVRSFSQTWLLLLNCRLLCRCHTHTPAAGMAPAACLPVAAHERCSRLLSWKNP